MAEPTSCCALTGSHCARTDALFSLDGVHVVGIARCDDGPLQLTVQTGPAGEGLPRMWGSRGQSWATGPPAAIPAFGAPVQLTWLFTIPDL
jgi:hypothetical protein